MSMANSIGLDFLAYVVLMTAAGVLVTAVMYAIWDSLMVRVMLSLIAIVWAVFWALEQVVL